MVTRGDFIDQDKVTTTAKPSVIVSCDEFKPYSTGIYERGVDVAVVTDGRSDLAMVNTLNRLPNIMAKREAEKKRCYEALLVTKKGFVMSGSQSNVFAVLDGILLTPPVGERVPPGITREAVLSIAAKEGIPCKEDALINDEMGDAEEMFMTGTLIEVMPVASIDGSLVGSGDPGHQTKRIMQAFKLMTRGAY
jgi:branched-subunit amino acid aminotransferase/4-amino-4-deoxychorismate lyase